MIKINRTATPTVLVANGSAWKNEIKLALGLLVKDPKNKQLQNRYHSAINKYQHAGIKTALVDMLSGKCAYCESFIQNVDYGDIEHFKPKDKFPLDAVNWQNLLLACKKCNGKEHKGNEWPSKKEGGPLINPCKDNPSSFFKFEFDTKTEMAIVVPKSRRGITSEKIYGLNRSPLTKDRNTAVRRLVALATYYRSDIRAKILLDEAALDSSEYSAFAKMILKKFA